MVKFLVRRFPSRLMIGVGTEPFIHTMISRLQNSIALQITLSALSVVRMEPMARSRIGDYLVPSRAASLVGSILKVYGGTL